MFHESFIRGVFTYQPHHFSDHRGSIAKPFNKPAFQEQGIFCDYAETLLSRNKHAGTVRGFHFQRPPYAQSKLIFCISGAVRNFLLDLRRGSPSYGQIDTVALSDDTSHALIVPQGVANAFCIDKADTLILYHLTGKHMPEYEGGVRWDSVGVDFGVDAPVISEKDAKLPCFSGFESPFVWEG